jgi:hypothetical protein
VPAEHGAFVGSQGRLNGDGPVVGVKPSH